MGASKTLALTLDLMVFYKRATTFSHERPWPNIRGAGERCETDTSGSCSKSHMSEIIILAVIINIII